MARHNESEIQKELRAIDRRKKYRRLMPIALSGLGALIVLTYLVSLMYSKVGSFTISVNKYQHKEYGISLSETSDFSQPTEQLTCKASNEITNIDGSDLDDVDFGAVDGADNGDNYLCYTFYLKNTGKETLDIDETISIGKTTLGIEKAVRVRVIKKLNDNDTETTTYARAKGVENGVPIPEDGCTIFKSGNTVLSDTIEAFNPNSIMKYTVVIWLEGPDLECVDDIIGGEFRIDMHFNVLGHYELEE